MKQYRYVQKKILAEARTFEDSQSEPALQQAQGPKPYERRLIM